VLIFIGAKMLAENWLHEFLSKNELVLISLLVIVVCLGGSIVYSLRAARGKRRGNDIV
jgi:tellurite resistance protein TerC